jgi:antitoxin ParD1/3/4
MPTSVALSSHFETFVREQVASGRYNNVSEVVRAGLRLLEDEEKLRDLTLAQLRGAIVAGLESGTERDVKPVFERLEAKYSALLQDKD